MASSGHLLALQSGTVVGNYRVIRPLGEGGFGITYLADHVNLPRRVALKELLPIDFATRAADTTVVPRSPDTAGDLEWASERFLQEAQNLALCEHRNVVRVYDVFQANGTVYMPMGYEEGSTLSQWLDQLGRVPTHVEVMAVVMPLLDGLALVHERGLLHRDIKPDNIYISSEDGRPILLDFGAAREAVVSRSRPVTSLVSAGYTPLEQYSTEEAERIGPASDLYSLGATVYRMITGKKPPDATRRMRRDPYVPLKECEQAGGYDPGFLAAVDWTLAVDEADRPQDVAAFRAAIISPAQQIKPIISRPQTLGEALSKAKGSEGLNATPAVIDRSLSQEVTESVPQISVWRPLLGWLWLLSIWVPVGCLTILGGLFPSNWPVLDRIRQPLIWVPADYLVIWGVPFPTDWPVWAGLGGLASVLFTLRLARRIRAGLPVSIQAMGGLALSTGFWIGLKVAILSSFLLAFLADYYAYPTNIMLGPLAGIIWTVIFGWMAFRLNAKSILLWQKKGALLVSLAALLFSAPVLIKGMAQSFYNPLGPPLAMLAFISVLLLYTCSPSIYLWCFPPRRA